MNKLKLASGVLLVFLVGVLGGSLGTGFYYKKRVEKFEAGGPPVQERIQIILGRFSDELDLTREQRDEFEKIVKESQEKKIELASKIQPEIKQINDDTFDSIKNKLTDEQKSELEMLIKRMDDVHDRFQSSPRQQQRTPDQSRPQGGVPQQVPPQQTPDQGPPQGNPGQNPLGASPDPLVSNGDGPGSIPSRKDHIRIIDDLRERLDLSRDQSEKIRPIIDKFFNERQNLFDKYPQEKADSNALNTALMEAEKSFENDLSNILTKEQMDKYREEKKNGSIALYPPDMP